MHQVHSTFCAPFESEINFHLFKTTEKCFSKKSDEISSNTKCRASVLFLRLYRPFSIFPHSLLRALCSIEFNISIFSDASSADPKAEVLFLFE